MWVIDDEFLEGVVGGGEPFVSTVTVPRSAPYFDIEVVSDARAAEADPARFVQRFRRLRRPFNEGRPSHLLVGCGDLVASRATQPVDVDAWAAGIEKIRTVVPEVLLVPGNHDVSAPQEGGSAHDRLVGTLIRNRRKPAPGAAVAFASVTRVCISESFDDRGAFAYVVVIGFDSNRAERENRLAEDHGQVGSAQLEAAEQLVRALAHTVSRDAPLYVIGATHHELLPNHDWSFTGPSDREELASRADELECQAGHTGALAGLCMANHLISRRSAGNTADAAGFLERCGRLGMSMVFHAEMRRREALALTSTSLTTGGMSRGISVLACPSFSAEARHPGMARIRLNIWKGEAEIAFSDESEAGDRAVPIQIVRTIESASRVAASERRLFDAVRQLLKGYEGSAAAGASQALNRFQEYVETNWRNTGYVPLCDADGALPDIPVSRRVRYYLLFLLRERAEGRFDILLSRHSPLKGSKVGEWSTLLLPAFSDGRFLLEHLRDDVVRQVVERAEDLEMAAHVRAFEEAVDRILNDADQDGAGVWTDELLEVASTTKRKISPTTGLVTEYEYHLVTALPLVRNPDSIAAPGAPDGEDTEAASAREQRRRDYNTIVDWLNELPSVSRHDDRPAGGRVVPLDALRMLGTGLQPDSPDGYGDAAWSAQTLGALPVPPGAIWFPLNDVDDPTTPIWRQCPSIVARNADVMQWVDRELAYRWRLGGGAYPPEIVLGKLRGGLNPIDLTGPQYPFRSAAGSEPPPDDVSASTVEALGRVRFMPGYDLEDAYAYQGMDIKRIFLIRRDIPVWAGERPAILLFDADSYDRDAVQTAPVGSAIGVLRPVQRYVLRTGIERARELHEQVLTKMDDPWGYLRIRRHGASRPLAVTPPIVESLHPEDWEEEHQGRREYVLCDGTHRVVELVWNQRIAVPAVAVVGTPPQPYYARPFSKFEWGYTADNVLTNPPDQPSKYAVRNVDRSQLPRESAEMLAAWDDRLLYRRYFRDLTAGFGYMGGQGGRS